MYVTVNNSPARLRSPPTYLPACWIGLNKYLPRYTITQSRITTTTYLGTVQGWTTHLSYPRFSFYLPTFRPTASELQDNTSFPFSSHLWVCIGKIILPNLSSFCFVLSLFLFLSFFFSFPRNQLDTVRDVQLLNREKGKQKRKKEEKKKIGQPQASQLMPSSA